MMTFFKCPLRCLLVLTALCTLQCTHRYYAPNTIEIPRLRQKNDAAISMGASIGPEYDGFEAHAIYSPIPKGLVMANFFKAGSNKANNAEFGEGHLWEIGAGAYFPIDQRNVFSVITGYGQGKVHNYYGMGRMSDVYYSRIFLQPTISAQFRYIHLGFGLRFARLHYSKLLADYRIDEAERNVINDIAARSPIWMPEYALRFGWRLGAVTLNNTVTYSPSGVAESLHFAGSNLNLGIAVDIQRLFGKKDKPVEPKE